MNDKHTTASQPAAPLLGLGSSEGLGPLVPCPLCGAENGYSLAVGSTYRWWYVSCATCGDELGECPADRAVDVPPQGLRWQPADEHWNRTGAHAHKLRTLLARYRDETPMGHQPHMIAHQADEALGRA